ncbi:MAG: M56 family metallopeptidase [Planctomycetota bacterium]
MNSLQVLSGTSWQHAVGYAAATVLLLSTLAAVLAKWFVSHPARRHLILSTSLVVSLFVPFVCLKLIYSPSSIIEIPIELDRVGQSTSTVRSPTWSELHLESQRIEYEFPTDEGSADSATPFIPDGELVSSGHADLQQASAFTLAEWSMAVWLLGSVFMLAVAIRAFRSGLRLQRNAKKNASPRATFCLGVAADRVGLNSVPRFLLSSQIGSPAVIGFLRPAVLFPTCIFEQLSDEELVQVLTHELAHVRRRDTLCLMVSAGARIMFWPIVTVYIALRELDRAREEICDNYVLAHTDPLEYSQTLLRLATYVNVRNNGSLGLGIFQRPGTFESRITGLLDPNRIKTRSVSYRAFLMCALAVSFAGFVSTSSRIIVTASDETKRHDISEPGDGTERADTTTQRDASSEDASDDLETFVLRVVDWKGIPVVGAEVVVDAIAYGTPATGSGNINPASDQFVAFSGLTNDEGVVGIPHPPSCGPADEPTCALFLSIKHPDQPLWSGRCSFDSSGEIKLAKPVRVSIACVSSEDGKAITSDLHVWTGRKSLGFRLNNGLLQARAVDPNGEPFLVVHAPPNGATSFSTEIDLSAHAMKQGHIAIKATLDPSISFNGQLHSDQLIETGKVIAQCMTGPWTSAWWTSTAEVKPDGSFELRNLPAGRLVQLIAVSEHAVNQSLMPSIVRQFARENGFDFDNYNGTLGEVSPQLFFTDKSKNITVPMGPTSDISFTVLDLDDQPISGAKVSCLVNQNWIFGGSQLVGAGSNSLTSLKKPGTASHPSRDGLFSFIATTNAKGRVTIRHLPAVVKWYSHPQFGIKEQVTTPGVDVMVHHQQYELVPSQSRFRSRGLQTQAVNLSPGETTEITLKMKQRKSADEE